MRNITSPFSSDYAASEEQNDEEGTFVALDPDSTGSVDGSGEATFGPLAMLAVGFLAQEFAALEQMLDEMGADEVKLIPCTSSMLQNCSLSEALSTSPPPSHEQPSSEAKPVVFLSGMYASEVIEVVGALRDSADLPKNLPIAAAVPKSWERPLSELVSDVHSDHEAMAIRRTQQQLLEEGAGESDNPPTQSR